ncbi:hypothetical protein B0H67DRAFT_478582 [Lasiosphaeris hirsuta]|uniref:Uncharacterized protein n=1 Tax=Lasiosphaeris hirsuta TaxID=260670 RepID=A0AA40E8K0_9PEZI|nr:hypothetical protein B0H67DRAFT_478582 [Lasiosphaeris hirsuta]
MRGEDPSADSACVEGREGSDDPQPTPALHLCGSAATLPDQFERARLHRKLVKRGHGGSKVVKRQPPADEVKKQQTAVTRQIRACIRCHLQRIRVCCFPSEEDPHGLCLTCELSKPTFCRLPCIRYKVTDVPLFRLGPSDNYIWTKRWLGKSLKDISKWASEDTTSILLTQDHGGTAINVSVKKFIPVYGDTLNYFWITGSGHKKTLGCTPFAIANLEQVSAEVKRHIKQSVTEHVATFTDNRTAILSKTFSMVMRTAEQANLLNEVLELWVASRLIEKPWRVQCGQLLGHILEDNHPFFDSESPYFGRIPVTPMMDQQLDQVVIKTALLPLKRSVQRSLRSLIEANKPDHWFTIYLCIFVLLSNYEIATQHDRGYAIRYSLQERFANYPLLQGFHTGAKTMLAHFHYCNKGGTPFQLDWSNTPAVVEWANLGSDQIAYMKDLVDTLKQECQDYKQLKRSRAYEVDGYLLSQLFDSSSEWQPEHML